MASSMFRTLAKLGFGAKVTTLLMSSLPRVASSLRIVVLAESA